ncbi:hypothetical protein D039_3310A, partial [Vibrio parahaemolyticus EKP-028]
MSIPITSYPNEFSFLIVALPIKPAAPVTK